MRPRKPCRIFRKLRLADLQRTCRLPLGARQSRSRPKLGSFRGPTKCLAWGNVRWAAASLGGQARSLRPSQPISGHFFGTHSTSPANLSDYEGLLAIQFPGRAYYSLVADRQAVAVKANDVGTTERGVLAGRREPCQLAKNRNWEQRTRGRSARLQRPRESNPPLARQAR